MRSSLLDYTADQLLSEARSGYLCSYTYDGNGNRLTKTLNGVTDSYSYDDGDKLLAITRGGATIKSFGYDAQGRTTSVTTSSGTTSLSYDFDDRVTGITYPNSTTNAFGYNALDTRVSQTAGGSTKSYLRDGIGVTAPVLSDGSATFTPGVSVRSGGTSTFQASDRLGSFTAQTNAAQAVSATREYDAFGNPLSSSGSPQGPFGFAGAWGYQEDVSGLQLLGHRYYDPSTGRFLTRDPIKDGRNWYGYCSNSPHRYVDPSGLSRLTWLYKLVDAAGDLIKWGITWNPGRRYTKKYLQEAEYTLEKDAVYDDRAIARADERMLVEETPGPLNREPWAGVREVGAALDPTPIGIAMEAGESFGKAIDPWVEEKKDQRSRALDWWLSDATE